MFGDLLIDFYSSHLNSIAIHRDSLEENAVFMLQWMVIAYTEVQRTRSLEKSCPAAQSSLYQMMK